MNLIEQGKKLIADASDPELVEIYSWIDQAIEVLKKLPRTADGVPVVPGMKVYWNGIVDVYEYDVEIQGCAGGNAVWSEFTGCYSTREAALAAKEGGK